MDITYEQILEQVKSGDIFLVDMEPTDTEGYCCDTIYQYNDTKFYVYLSAYAELSYEEQAAKQIFEDINKDNEYAEKD